MSRIRSVSLPSEDAVWMALTYDPDTGLFHRRKTGKPAGSKTAQGYTELWVAGARVYAHRVAWFMSYGDWPEHEVDHINGDRSDNRIANLRDVTRSMNRQNTHKPKGKSGIVGVEFKDGRWIARFMGKHLGCFKTAEAAKDAYMSARTAR